MKEHERTGPMDLFSWGLSRVAMWAVPFIVIIIFIEVTLRYAFASPTLWVNETSLWVAGGVYLIAGSYALQQRNHIRIFLFYDMAPLGLRRLFDVISTVCFCLFAFGIIWGGFNEALTRLLNWERFGTAFNPPIPATMKPLILLTMALMAVQAVSNLINDWNEDQRESRFTEAEEAASEIAETMAAVGVEAAPAKAGPGRKPRPKRKARRS